MVKYKYFVRGVHCPYIAGDAIYASQSAQTDTFLMARHRAIEKVSNARTMPLWLR